jgi:DNA-directed RNA polymerase subunit RPC12/RpoP
MHVQTASSIGNETVNDPKIQKLNCTRCGGVLCFEPGQRVIRCQYCGGKNLLRGDSDLPRYYLPEQVTSEKVLSIAGNIINKTSGTPSNLSDKVQMQQPQLFWVPFYEITGTRLALFEEKKLRRNQISTPMFRMSSSVPQYAKSSTLKLTTSRDAIEQASPHKIKIDSKVVLGDFMIDDPAVTMTDWGLDAVKLNQVRRGSEGVSILPFRLRELQRRGTVLYPDKSFERFFATHTKLAGTRTIKNSSILEQETNLIYYPVWRVIYSYRKAMVPVVIDGLNGKILNARLPLSEKYRVMAFLAGTGPLGIGLGGVMMAIHLLTHAVDLIMHLWVIMFTLGSFFGVIIFGLMAFAWVHLRYSAEIVIRGSRRDIHYVGKSGKTFPEKMFDRYSDWFSKIRVEIK